MTAVSSLVTRASNEINDTTSNTFSSSLTGIGLGELTQYAIDGISDYSNYVFRECFNNSIITSANLRSYVVSALNPVPEFITRLEYVETSTSLHKIPDVELWNGSMYLWDQDEPLFTNYDGKYFNMWYLARHTIPGAASATITLPTQDEGLIVDFIKIKAFKKMAADQRGINQDSASEFLAMAVGLENSYKDQIRKRQTAFVSYTG